MLNYFEKSSPTDQLYVKFNSLPTVHQELIIKFFICFARLEFLLKWKGYIYNDGQVSWVEFYKAKNIEFENSFGIPHNSELQAAIDYLFREPPQKLTKKKQGFEWRRFQDDDKSRLEQLSLYIKRVRNNLFHGNKNTGLANARDEQLLKYSLLVIDELVLFLDGETDFVEEAI